MGVVRGKGLIDFAFVVVIDRSELESRSFILKHSTSTLVLPPIPFPAVAKQTVNALTWIHLLALLPQRSLHKPGRMALLQNLVPTSS